MSFDTRAGTRGAKQPKGRFLTWANKLVTRRVRKGRGGLVVLITVGRKSGAKRESPLRGFAEANGVWLVVGSAGGAAGNPGWYHNLAANPDKVQLISAGKTVDVVAEQLHGAEREEAWRRITGEARQFATYQEKTDRLLPVIRLTPR